MDKDKVDDLLKLRGIGNPRDGDFLYGSIYESSPSDETIVGLQHKFLFLLNVLQSADERPTTQSQNALERLEKNLSSMIERYEALD